MKSILSLTVAALFLAAAVAPAATKEEEVAKYMADLKNKEAAKRKAAAEEIGKIGAIKVSAAKPALQPLLEMVKDKDGGVRAAVAEALAKLDEPTETVPALIDMVKSDSNNNVKMAAANGLGLIGSPAREAVPALRELQKDAKSDEAKKLARAAGDAIKQIEGKMKK